MIQIRFLAAADTVADSDLRGVIEHVGSGRRASFRDVRELTAFLHAEQQRLGEGTKS